MRNVPLLGEYNLSVKKLSRTRNGGGRALKSDYLIG